MAIAFEYHERTTWPLLSIAVVAAAVRNRLPGALIVWAVTSIAYAAAVLGLGERAAHPEDVPFAISMHLLIALVTGTQASTFTRQLSELQKARLTLQQQVLQDGLTGLPNRLGLAAYAAEFADRPLVVLLLDLDGFKPVNDTFGHGVGDEVLRIVGTRLTACLRAGDMVGRLGGDEFLVLLPEADDAAARRVMGAVRAAVAEPMTVHGHQIAVGVSVGAAVRPGGGAAGLDLDALTARADAAMYRAKSRSRITARAY